MYQKVLFLACWVMALLWMGCKPGSPPPPAEAPATAVSASVATTPPVKEASTVYAILTNLEMVEYCLPYPKDAFQEDYEAAESKGQHVLVSKDRRSRIIFSGQFFEDEFVVLYHDVQAEVQELMAQPLHDAWGEDHFELSWQRDSRVTWMKKWHRPAAQETVTAQVEYPEDQAAALEPLLATLAKATTLCE